MLFDEEKKGPSEFTTRNIITSLLFTYLKSASPRERSLRAKVLLSYLKDPQPKEEERPVGFVLQMRQDRPYRVWCKEVVNVTKEVFWIFLHNLNVVPLSPSSSNIASRWDAQHHEVEPGNSTSTAATPQSTSHDITDSHLLYMQKHFPQERPPVAAAPYVGGVEWDATNYLASHLDLINGILASLETKDERTELRGQLRISGWERCMGSKLRLCKEKFYGSVHSALRNWVDAAAEDAWDVRDVRYGPQAVNQSPARKSPAKKKVDEAPKIEMLRLDLGFDERNDKIDDEWL